MLKQILFQRNIKQSQLAKKLGVTQQLVSKWVTGGCQPQIDMLPKLAEALNCSVEEIVNCFKEPQKNFSARM